MTQRLTRGKFDIPLMIVATALVFFGLLAIYDASVVAAFRDFGDKFYYIKNQLIWACLGFAALIFFSFYDYHRLFKFSAFFLLLAILFLLLVLVPQIGTKVYGARRWINIGSFTFQPSEITKLALILYQTNIISKFEKFKIRLSDSALVYFLPTVIATVLVILQPDLGTALIFLGVALAIYFIGGAPLWHFLISLPALMALAAITVVTQPYRIARIKTLIDPSFDPQGASYQINQILIALASGGLFGVGIGASRSKFAFIPEVQSDAIFAIVVEELGFVGGTILISIFILLVIRAINIAKVAKDFEGKVLAGGIASLLAIQSFFNLASIVALVPLTGIPLPFISYGGSSLFVTMAAIGILISIKRQT